MTGRILFTMFLLFTLAVAGYRLQFEKQQTDQAIGQLKNLFQAAAAGECRVDGAVLQQQASLLPDTVPAVQQAMFFNLLQEAVGVMDDYGIDRKWTSITQNDIMLCFRTEKNGGFTCCITFVRKDNVYTITSVSGVEEVIADWRRCAVSK